MSMRVRKRIRKWPIMRPITTTDKYLIYMFFLTRTTFKEPYKSMLLVVYSISYSLIAPKASAHQNHFKISVIQLAKIVRASVWYAIALLMPKEIESLLNYYKRFIKKNMRIVWYLCDRRHFFVEFASNVNNFAWNIRRVKLIFFVIELFQLCRHIVGFFVVSKFRTRCSRYPILGL